MTISPSTTTSSSKPNSIKEKLHVFVDALPVESSFVDLSSDAAIVSNALLHAADEKGLGHAGPSNRNGRTDEAFEILASGSRSSESPTIKYVSAEENDRIVKKIDRQ